MRSFIQSTFISFLVMFGLTYMAIDTVNHFYVNINKLYMAAIMTAPMIIIKAVTMRSMLSRRQFALSVGVGTVLTVLLFIAIRTQFGVGDQQFLRSMIPHHSSAIVMCEDSQITDPEIIALCDEIVATQKREITLMQEMLEE